MAKKIGGLGKGLDMLFQNVEINTDELKAVQDEEKEALYRIDINDIKPNANQPRKIFDREKIEDLAASIKEHGVIQPIVVRKQQNGYELVAGERRWRAARIAGIKKIPCIVKELDNRQNMLLAIVENMQRENLNPIEEAEGLESMIKTYDLTQEEVSKSVGKSRSYITNSLRLLKLNENIRRMISEGKISAAHGRTLAGIGDLKKRQELAERIYREELSVRDIEDITRNSKNNKKKKRAAERQRKDADTMAVEKELADIFGSKVTIKGGTQRGSIEIEYYGKEDLNRLIEMLRKE